MAIKVGVRIDPPFPLFICHCAHLRSSAPALVFVRAPPVTTYVAQAPIRLLNACNALDFLMTEHPKVMSILPLRQLRQRSWLWFKHRPLAFRSSTRYKTSQGCQAGMQQRATTCHKRHYFLLQGEAPRGRRAQATRLGVGV